ncbi:unnamed protein product [Gongylonema pulchrum]|uniref:Reverse transcriptase domain-containing protein n=1 Tax=Gongylonema pulchrum TaxID=637853 RepID=A0A183D5T5_9BILA|nr:unnamed protein product [Gongylonema pulchrum]
MHITTKTIRYVSHSRSFGYGTVYSSTGIGNILRTVDGEAHVRFSGYIFQQVKGIPMGSNASSDTADLTLSVLEFKFSRIPSNPPLLLCRYVDDLLVLNYPDSRSLLLYLYGQYLDIEITGSGNSVDYLDITFSLDKARIGPTLCCKCDQFTFPINKYSSLHSSVYQSVYDGTIYSQLIRYSRTESLSQGFIFSAHRLLLYYSAKGFPPDRLHRLVGAFIHKNRPHLAKYFPSTAA